MREIRVGDTVYAGQDGYWPTYSDQPRLTEHIVTAVAKSGRLKVDNNAGYRDTPYFLTREEAWTYYRTRFESKIKETLDEIDRLTLYNAKLRCKMEKLHD